MQLQNTENRVIGSERRIDHSARSISFQVGIHEFT